MAISHYNTTCSHLLRTTRDSYIDKVINNHLLPLSLHVSAVPGDRNKPMQVAIDDHQLSTVISCTMYFLAFERSELDRK